MSSDPHSPVTLTVVRTDIEAAAIISALSESWCRRHGNRRFYGRLSRRSAGGYKHRGATRGLRASQRGVRAKCDKRLTSTGPTSTWATPNLRKQTLDIVGKLAWAKTRRRKTRDSAEPP